MLSDAEAKRNRKELLRQIAAEHKKKDRETLRRLREKIREVKARRAHALCMVRGSCRRGRALAKQTAKAKAKAIRARASQEIRDMRKAETSKARAKCKARKLEVRRAAGSSAEFHRETMRAEKGLQAELKRIDGWTRKQQSAHRSSAKELREESDDAVRSNIPAELRPLFEKVKKQIKGSTRRSRTEEFLHYVEENPNEVVDAQEGLAELEIRRLVREQYALEEAMQDPKRYRPTAAELEEVPF